MFSMVAKPDAADSRSALEYFQNLLRFETDCWDVHYALSHHMQDFVLLDVRSKSQFEKGHIEGAINLPHGKINHQALNHYAMETLFIVYCAGPHCNATERAAIKLARLSRPVKKMIGGVTGWLDEKFELVTGK